VLRQNSRHGDFPIRCIFVFNTQMIDLIMDEKTYSEAQVLELVAREVMKQRMATLEQAIGEGERRSVSTLSEIKAQVQALFGLVERQSTTMKDAADGLREEIKKDFATKKEVSADFDKLNTKIDTQWSKLVLIVSTITAAITAVGVLAQFFIRSTH
jgi:hypothetical protein